MLHLPRPYTAATLKVSADLHSTSYANHSLLQHNAVTKPTHLSCLLYSIPKQSSLPAFSCMENNELEQTLHVFLSSGVSHIMPQRKIGKVKSQTRFDLLRFRRVLGLTLSPHNGYPDRHFPGYPKSLQETDVTNSTEYSP
jgi:hypothetical protein